MVLPSQMTVEDSFFYPIPHIAHITELPLSLFHISRVRHHPVNLGQQLEDSTKTLVDMGFKFFGAVELHIGIVL